MKTIGKGGFFNSGREKNQKILCKVFPKSSLFLRKGKVKDTKRYDPT